MALVPCIECNKQISDRAVACPHCGYPNELQDLPQRNLANQQRNRVLGKDPNAGQTLAEIQRKQQFHALLRAQSWKTFATLFSFVSFIASVIYPIYIAISTSSANPLLLWLLPVVSIVGSGAFFNITPSLTGVVFAFLSFVCLMLAGIIINLGFAHVGGIDGSGGYWILGWLLFFSYWLVNRKAPAEAIKASRLLDPEKNG